jgi:hypothetical protein
VGRERERRTRAQILQSHSPITSSSSASGPRVFSAMVMAPQWQDPVYVFPPGISASGSGPVKRGGVYVGSGAEPFECLIGRDHRSRFCSARACIFFSELGKRLMKE